MLGVIVDLLNFLFALRGEEISNTVPWSDMAGLQTEQRVVRLSSQSKLLHKTSVKKDRIIQAKRKLKN